MELSLTWFAVAQVALMLGLAVLIAVFVLTLFQLIKTLKTVEILAKNLNEQVLPLAEEIKTLLSGVNSKLASVEGLATSVREVSEKIQITSQAARKVVSGPASRVAGWAGSARVFLQAIATRAKK